MTLPPEDRKLIDIALRPDPVLPAAGKGPRWRGPKADKVYQEARDSLLPLAEAVANKVLGAAPAAGEAREVWARHWDVAFHVAMAELWETRGRALERTFGPRDQVYVEGLRVRYRFVELNRVPKDVLVIRDKKVIARERRRLVEQLDEAQRAVETKTRTVLIKEVVE